MKSEPKVSIIILTYNSEDTLDRCLRAVKEVEYPENKLEIILLDNGSSDATVDIIKKYGCTWHYLPHLNLSQLRNHGAEISTGEVIAFVDSDCVIAPDWCRQIVKWFADGDVGIVGNEYLLPEDASMLERNWYNKSNYGVKYDELIPAGNMAISKKHFERLGGFDNRLKTGEDDYIVGVFRQAGLLTVSDHLVHSVHLGNAKTLRQYFKKETWYGLGMLGTIRFAKVDKPLVVTLLFTLSALLSAVFLSAYFVQGKISFLFMAGVTLAFTIALPLLAALERIYKKNRRGNIFYVMLVFMVFFTARLRALFTIAASRYTENHQS